MKNATKTMLGTLLLGLAGCGGGVDPYVAPRISIESCREIERTTEDMEGDVYMEIGGQAYIFYPESVYDVTDVNSVKVKNRDIDLAPFCTVSVVNGIRTVYYGE